MKLCLVAALAVILAACAPVPRRAGIPTQWLASPNFDERRPNFVILHHTSGDSAGHSLATLTDPARKVSAHYLVGRDGTLYQLVDERARAWHAGESYWGGNTDLNSASLGIELDNNGGEPFAAVQIEALLRLLRDITERYRIPAANFLGHGDVAPGRKVDPSVRFPWELLARQGFGLWCDPPYPLPPGAPDAATQLRAFGYDVTHLGAAIAAFRRHFRQDESSGFDVEDIALLHCLITRMREQNPAGIPQLAPGPDAVTQRAFSR